MSKTIPVKPSKDRQVEEMIADPNAYFAKVRREARDAAELAVARRSRGLAPRVKRKRRGALSLRFPFPDGRIVRIEAVTPLTAAEFDYLTKALADLRPAFVGNPDGSS